MVTKVKKSGLASNAVFEAGTRTMFHQASSPVGWTQDATQNEKALRVVGGVGGGSGGSVDFSTAFASKSVSGALNSVTVTGTVGATTLALSQIPSHTHTSIVAITGGDGSKGVFGRTAGNTGASGSTGSHDHTISTNAHGHTFTGNAIDLAVKYVNIIIAQKD